MQAVDLSASYLERLADDSITDDGKLDAWIQLNRSFIILDVGPHKIYELSVRRYNSEKDKYTKSVKKNDKVDALIREIDARLARLSR
ncbi:hypothetical protein HYW20_04765 [Candidatus Woesearchaeota archaeon]|nr:hypothetical protein [Candidatus Woesearchaeota archaeon]